MQPAGFTDVTIVNATSQNIVVGPSGSNNWINNTYQMSQWFNTTPGTLLVNAQSTDCFDLQFLSGASDEDDGADSVFAFGNSSNAQQIHFMGRSNTNSAHYFGFELSANFSTPMVIGVNMNQDWNAQISPTQITWYAYNSDNMNTASNIGFVNNSNGTFIVADLSQVFLSQAIINSYYNAIVSNNLTTEQQDNLFTAIWQYVYSASEIRENGAKKKINSNTSGTVIFQNNLSFAVAVSLYLPSLLLYQSNVISIFNSEQSASFNILDEPMNKVMAVADYCLVAAFILDGSPVPPRLTITNMPDASILNGNTELQVGSTSFAFSVGGGYSYNAQNLYAEPIAIGVIRFADFYNSENILALNEDAETCKVYWSGGVNPTPVNS